MNEAYKKIIVTMAGVDQDLRLSARPGKGPLNYLIYVIDAIHRLRILELVGEYGYPTQRLVGKEGMKKFWLLIQHQDMDQKLQRECLKRCDFAPPEKAYLTDRILVNGGKSQRYGTQFYLNEEKRHVPRPIENAARVDERRKKAGLSTLKEYTAEMRRAYRASTKR